MLKGRTPDDININYLKKKYGEDYYAVQIVDDTVSVPDETERARYDVTLKGEFIRMVMEKDWPENEKQEVIRIGTCALEGKEIL